jgi:hypothetical protein
MMHIKSEKDFPMLRQQFQKWRKQFPMFTHDVNAIENIIEKHIQDYSISLVHYRQTHQNQYLEKAQKEIDSINLVLSTVSKMELMALLARG